MNKIFKPTAQNVRNALALRGTVTVWDYYRHLLISGGYINNPEYLYSSHTYKGKRYITITAR